MAVLGDLVVNLTANSSKFNKGLSSAQSMMNKFTAVAIAGATAAIARVASVGDQFDKMAIRTGVSVEQLSRLRFAAEQSGSSIQSLETALKKTSVLILDADRGLSTATDTLDELGLSVDSFAGQSPDKQFETLADAISKIEDPSRRSALAVKAFGRSGTELLPLIMAGADGIRQFGEESDSLGATVTRAQATLGAQLTDAFNRVKRAADGAMVTIGEKLGPVVVKIADVFARLISTTAKYADEIVLVGKVIVAATVAMKTITIATQAYTKATAIAQALSGPKGWIQLAAGLAVATATVVALDHAFDDFNESAAASEQSISGVSVAMDDMAERAKAISEVENAQAQLASRFEQMEGPIDQVNAKVEEFTQLMLKAGELPGAMDIAKVREFESGFTETMRSLTDELSILRGDATETGLILQQMLDAGVKESQIEKLRALFEERDKLLSQQEADEYWKNYEKNQQAAADAIAKSLLTPDQQFASKMKEIQSLVSGGFLTQTQADMFGKKLSEQLGLDTPEAASQSRQQFAGVQQKGSAEAFATIVRAMNQSSPELKESQKQTKHLMAIAKNTGKNPEPAKPQLQGAV